MKQHKKGITETKSVEPKKEDLVKLANDLYRMFSGKNPDETAQLRLSAAVNVVQAIKQYNPREADALTAIQIYELADQHLKSEKARRAAYEVAETYQKNSGFYTPREKQ